MGHVANIMVSISGIMMVAMMVMMMFAIKWKRLQIIRKVRQDMQTTYERRERVTRMQKYGREQKSMNTNLLDF